jgi:glucose 1-dehydrogenase
LPRSAAGRLFAVAIGAHATAATPGRLMAKYSAAGSGEPEDLARVVVWLAFDDSDYVVGATLFVDGGMTLFPDFAEGG